MSPVRSLPALVVALGGLVGGLLAVAPAQAVHGASYDATARAPLAPQLGKELKARNAYLGVGNRATGMPAPGSDPYEQFGTLTFEMNFQTNRVYVEAKVAANPELQDRPQLRVQAGTVTGTTCNGLPGTSIADTFTTTAEAVEYIDIPAGWAGATCVIALVFPATSTPGVDPPSDALVGPLTDEVVQPVLQIGRPELLGSTKLKLVPGVWTPLEVEVANTGTGPARAVVVTGKGKGVKVKKDDLGYALDALVAGDDPQTGTVDLMVRLRPGTSKAKLTLSASSDGETYTSKVRLRATKAPPKAEAGSYRSKDGSVRFTVKNGKVVGFRVSTTTRCGGYPDIPTTTSNTYDFPTTRISGAGIVHDRQSTDLFTANLEMLVTGGKATRGRFSYSGPARCFATESFDAKRVGG